MMTQMLELSWFSVFGLLIVLVHPYFCTNETYKHSVFDCFFKLTGNVDDCACSIDAVNKFNNLHLFPLLDSLVKKDYFRYLPINLNRQCRFWSDDSRCALRDCHVKGCRPNELPKGLRIQRQAIPTHLHEKAKYFNPAANKRDKLCPSDENAGGLGKVDKSLSQDTKQAIKNWTLYDEQQDNFCELDDDYSDDIEYVDLVKNPERFTGYKGPSAHRIWNVIYKENCFQEYNNDFESQINNKAGHQCLEKRAFYRLISGLHSSISIHLCKDYLLKDYGNLMSPEWGPNVSEFLRRFHPLKEPDGPQRLKNLYFTYLFELRALVKAAPYLYKKGLFFTSNEQEGEETQKAMLDLLRVAGSFQHHFEELKLFQDEDKAHMLELKASFRRHFLNISRIMDCVGCDKCRLWGKLQIQGMGTALKILFSNNDLGAFSTVPQFEQESGLKFQLRRTEIISLVNALARLSTSIYSLEKFRNLLQNERLPV